MKGGNGASAASGITQFAEGEPNDMQNARKNLTRRRGEAEEVEKFSKILCDLCVLCGLKIYGELRSRSEEVSD